MITKFEKRIIAWILSLLICVTLIQVPVVEVYAEEEQVASEIGMTENADVKELEVVDVKEEELGDNLIEEKFIPIQEEKEEVLEEVQEEPKEIEDVVELSEEITEVSEGTFETTTNEQNQSKNYRFVPEQAGTYCIRFKGFIDCVIQTEYRYEPIWSMDTGEVYLNLNAGEECQIEIRYPSEYISGEDNLVKWSIEKPKITEVQVGEKHAEVAEENGWPSVYKFVPEKSGKYVISSAEYVDANFYEDNWNWKASGTAQLEAGQTYYIKLSYYSNLEWTLLKTEQLEIRENQKYTTTVDQAIEYKFQPQKSGRYQISFDNSETSFDVYNEDNSFITSGGGVEGKINLAASEIYYIRIKPRKTVTWSIATVEMCNIQEETEYVTIPGQPIDYKFVPQETGRYQFSFAAGTNFQLYNENWEFVYSEGSSQEYNTKVDLEKDKVYYINLNGEQDVAWSVTKVEIIKVQEGIDYTTIFNQPVYYEFIPQQTGTYFIDLKNPATCNVYDNNWINIETYQLLSQYGFRMELTAGETYYLEVNPDKDTTSWRVETVEVSGDYAYRIKDDGTAELLKYLGKESVVSVPEAIVGKTVSVLGEGVFLKNNVVTEITVPANVVEVQYSSFKDCTNLQQVQFAPNSKLERIEGYAFEYCEKLSGITIPNGVKKLGLQAFAYSGIKEVQIPNSVIEVKNSVFYSCPALQNVKIGNGLSEISVCMFTSCENLQKVEFESNSKVKVIKNSAFSSCENLSGIIIPESVQKIGRYAFSSTGIINIDIPNSVTEVGNRAFFKCAKLQSVTLGEGLKKINEFMFDGCIELTQVAFKGTSSVTEIEYGAFMGCSRLANMKLPASVQSMSGASMRETAWYENQADGEVYADQILYGYKGEVPENANVVVKTGTKGIASFAFDGQARLESIELPKGLTTIEKFSFYDCSSMRSIMIPESVTKIGKFALGYVAGDENDGIFFAGDWVYGYAKKISGFVIYGYSGTAAQQYAKDNGFKFISLGNVETEKKFVDIKETDWFYNAVMYVSENGIMTGITEDTFGPSKTLTRAQFATILHQLSGKPAIDYSTRFPDIPQGQWYTDGVLWASSVGIVGGYGNGLFGPEKNITREQMALMIQRYAKYKEYDISETADISSFEDANKVSSYAEDAFKWAVGSEIISGKAGNMLDPQGKANRAECAVIMMKFMEKYEK